MFQNEFRKKIKILNLIADFGFVKIINHQRKKKKNIQSFFF